MKNEMLEDKISKLVTERIMSIQNTNNITFSMAKHLAEFALKKALELNVNIVVSIVDCAGNLVLFNRMDNSLLISIKASQHKAFTALALKMSTKKLAELTCHNGELFGIKNTFDGKILPLAGGYPYVINSSVIGAIGISGGSLVEDSEIATYALKQVGAYVEGY